MPEIINEPVTGLEEIVEPTNALAALSQFYRALNARDLELMEQNWDNSEDAVMDNPLGGIRRGWVEIRAVYERLFSAPALYRFEFYDYTLHHFGNVFMVIGRERGEFAVAGGGLLRLAIRTTRVFRWTGNRWRQFHHHGSIDDPDMLARYQHAVLRRAA